MTREEEIFQEAKSRFSGEDHEMYQVRAFEAGAHWADSHPKRDEDDLAYIQELLGYDPIEEFDQICEECLGKGGKA